MRRALVVLLLTLVCSAGASAQVCSGFAPFNEARARVFADAAFSSIAERYHGGFIYGRSRLFASAEVGMTTFELDEWLDFDVGVGVQVPTLAGGRLQFCPQVFVGSTAGVWTDEFGQRIDYSEKNVSAGASGGYLIARTGRTQIAATATLLLIGGRATKTFTSGFSRSTDVGAYGTAAFGLGFQVNREVTLIPSIAVPFGTRHAGSLYRLRVSLTLGRSR